MVGRQSFPFGARTIFRGYIRFGKSNTPHNEFDKHLVKLYDISKIRPQCRLGTWLSMIFDFWGENPMTSCNRMPCFSWAPQFFMESYTPKIKQLAPEKGCLETTRRSFPFWGNWPIFMGELLNFQGENSFQNCPSSFRPLGLQTWGRWLISNHFGRVLSPWMWQEVVVATCICP